MKLFWSRKIEWNHLTWADEDVFWEVVWQKPPTRFKVSNNPLKVSMDDLIRTQSAYCSRPSRSWWSGWQCKNWRSEPSRWKRLKGNLWRVKISGLKMRTCVMSWKFRCYIILLVQSRKFLRFQKELWHEISSFFIFSIETLVPHKFTVIWTMRLVQPSYERYESKD